jgi:hypothetical protein
MTAVIALAYLSLPLGASETNLPQHLKEEAVI